MEKMPLVLKISKKLIDFFLSQHFAKLETNYILVDNFEKIDNCLGVEDVFAVGEGYVYGDVNLANLNFNYGEIDFGDDLELTGLVCDLVSMLRI